MGLIEKLFRSSEKRARKEAEQQAAAEEMIRRQLSPKFELIELKYGKPISSVLRELYENKEEIQRSDVVRVDPKGKFSDGIYVCWYEPLDELHIENQWEKDPALFEFANDGSGSSWVVDPTDNNAEIYFFDHEDESVTPTGIKLDDFLGLEEVDGDI